MTRVFWTYTNRFTETNAAGGSNTVKITPIARSAMKLIALTVTMADTAAARAVYIRHLDEDGAILSQPAVNISLDNQSLSLPSAGAVPAANNQSGTLGLIIVGDGSCLSILGDSLAQNEYFDVRCSWELLGTMTAPTITHTSSGTASTGTASQNEITVVGEW